MGGINTYSFTCASGYTGFNCETGILIQIDNHSRKTGRLLTVLQNKYSLCVNMYTLEYKKGLFSFHKRIVVNEYLTTQFEKA